MIKSIKHKGTGLKVQVTQTNEEILNGHKYYKLKGYFVSTMCINIYVDFEISEIAMCDFEITYINFVCITANRFTSNNSCELLCLNK